jgi:hypothetical protein
MQQAKRAMTASFARNCAAIRRFALPIAFVLFYYPGAFDGIFNFPSWRSAEWSLFARLLIPVMQLPCWSERAGS